MNIGSRTDAQRRADDIHTFNVELERLLSARVLALTADQRNDISAHQRELLQEFERAYDIDQDVRAKQLSLGMRIASFLGALALAASVFFLFRQFWDRFSTIAQVVILITSSVATFAATMWLQTRDSSGYFTKLAAMVAFACFVINITMLGYIFNIAPSDKALIPFAALALLLAYACDLRLLLSAGILCIIAWISVRTGTISGLYWLDFGDRPENFFPAALLLFAVPLVISHRRFTGFALVYRVMALLTLFLPMLVLANWGAASYVHFDPKWVARFYGS